MRPSALAPTGKLRAGINIENTLLARRDPASGDVSGLAVDLAQELGRCLAVPVDILAFETAGKIAKAVNDDLWDIALIAADPTRSADIAFSPTCLEIEATYLVPPGSTLERIRDVDQQGVRIAVPENTAFDLYLSRTLRQARLMRAKGLSAAFQLFAAERLEALAGLRPMLVPSLGKLPGARLLPDGFTVIPQAIAYPRTHQAGADELRAFVERLKASDWMAQALARYGLCGAPAERAG
jgi:polar amino acid transport system substrate-binding protein